MGKKIEQELKELTCFFEVETTMDHFNTEIYFKFINKFDNSKFEYKIDFWEIQNEDVEAKKMIQELNQIKKQTEREHKISQIL